MKQLPFTVADQRQNFIRLPCKEDIRQEYLHLIVCIKLNDAKAALASLLVICILIGGINYTFSFIENIYYLESTTCVIERQVAVKYICITAQQARNQYKHRLASENPKNYR